MSGGARIKYADAYKLAESVAADLKGQVEQIKCVGSLRRKKRDVGDIEFLVRPHQDRDLLDGVDLPILDPIRATLRELGTWHKGGSRHMRVTNIYGHPHAALDLYLVHAAGCPCPDCKLGPAAWGSMLAIRTGPAELSKYCVMRMKELGFRHKHGYAQRIGTWEIVPTPNEEDFFALAGVPCLPPRERDAQAARLWREYAATKRERSHAGRR